MHGEWQQEEKEWKGFNIGRMKGKEIYVDPKAGLDPVDEKKAAKFEANFDKDETNAEDQEVNYGFKEQPLDVE